MGRGHQKIIPRKIFHLRGRRVPCGKTGVCLVYWVHGLGFTLVDVYQATRQAYA